jgi:hypothetical protein
MLFIVEITLDGDLGREMSDMRVWLDHKHYGAISFRPQPSAVWHVDFEHEVEAREFAQAFYGRLVSGA